MRASNLNDFIPQFFLDRLLVNIEIRTIVHDDAARAIVTEARLFDLVVLNAARQRTTVGLAISDITTKVVNELTGSMVLLGEPDS
jgi:hypothetical protein